MSRRWDDRVVASELRDFLRDVQAIANCRLSGGAALSGLHLQHRLSKDLDLFCDSREDVRDALRVAADVADKRGGALTPLRDGGTFVRSRLRLSDHELEVDIAFEPSAPLAEREVVEGIVVDSLTDMQANKITCLLSRAEPRDLVDLYFLEKQGLKVEDALPGALEKDAGLDPAILAYLLTTFPLDPLPVMLKDLRPEDLAEYREELSVRLRDIVLSKG